MGPSIVSSHSSSDIRDVEDFGFLIASVVAALRISSLVAATMVQSCVKYPLKQYKKHRILSAINTILAKIYRILV